jgi:hypothetical protein
MIQPPSILLMGPSGSGKTFSLSTLVEAGLEIFVISTEPHGLESLLDSAAAKKLPLSMLHWRYIPPARPGFETLERLGKLISVSDQKSLADMRASPRSDAQWIELLKTMNNFKDDKDGKLYGDVTKFGPDRALVIDSLSGVSAMAMDVTIGDKVTANPGEWGIAMRALDKFLLTCTSDLKCYFILTAHTEREEDLITGASKIMVSTLGKKLAPQIPKFFSEVILADTLTEGDKRTHLWSTNSLNTVLKNRSLPISSKLQPSFEPIIKAYTNRIKQLKG